ncbi:NAD-dependent epimerase/dehydratase family protein [Micromonospora sp. NBC_00421]|uniref:NAD-dependent epimerase/dehydratase family protein n=1 Tax=Micromonospora sp. NBC_00421 TaxID=2975976 RepID=UPI002E1FCC90
MKILVLGGSGLIGTHVVDVLRDRGHTVTTVARTARPGVDHLLDLGSASTDDLRPLLAGQDGVVVATRADEQRVLPKPIRPVLHRELVDPVVRLLTAARDEGLSRAVVLGSYYTYFDRLHPQWRLAERHPYIGCRREQARQGRLAAGPELPVAVLELPFVFGGAGDPLPNWAGPLYRWARSRGPLVAPDGGTATVAARSVAEIAADALAQARGGDIPVADENLSWAEMITRIAEEVGRPRRVRRLPTGVVRVALRGVGMRHDRTGREAGLHPTHLADLLLTELFITEADRESGDR